jgi:hypothetical protein
MLKISFADADGEEIRFRLDGQITGLWVGLLRGLCEAALQKGTRIILEMKNVSFVDRDGVALLRSLAVRRVEILNALPFIAEQIAKAAP